MKSKKGFTLIELMIVVAIIGILAAIAIPNFLKFQCRSKQSEAKQNLGAIYTAMMSYYSNNDTYPETADISGQVDCWGLMSWGPSGVTRYQYQCGAGNFQIDAQSKASDVCNTAGAGSTTASTQTAFTVAAVGNLDTDDFCDEWAINDAKYLKNQVAGATWGANGNDCDLE